MDCKELRDILGVIKESQLSMVEIHSDNLHIKVENNGGYEDYKSVTDSEQSTNRPQINLDRERINEVVATMEVEELVEAFEIIKSPLVGEFSYKKKNDESYIKVGEKVKKGDVLCTIEAMKMVNEIKSKHDGIVVEILPQNQQLVEYGQPLIKINCED